MIAGLDGPKPEGDQSTEALRTPTDRLIDLAYVDDFATLGCRPEKEPVDQFVAAHDLSA
jgi:hypothetical protein